MPLSVKETFGTSGEWVDGGSRKRWAKSGTWGHHELEVTVYDPLSVSLNKQMFYSDETLVATIKMENIQSAYLQFDGQLWPFISSSSPDASDTIKLSTGFSDLHFQGSNNWYGFVNITVFYTADDGSTDSASVGRYIGVEQVGYFENKTLFNAYGTYEAKVVDSYPIKDVRWHVKKPGGVWEEIEHDAVNGGNSASLSYWMESASGNYRVRVVIFRENGKIINYWSGFYVY